MSRFRSTINSNPFWCRRRDSNSHSFRHYPLKIACLPISPRRRFCYCGWHEGPCDYLLSGNAPSLPLFTRQLRLTTRGCIDSLHRNGCSTRSRQSRRRWSARSGRRSGLCCGLTLQHAAPLGGSQIAEIRQRKSRTEKHGGQYGRAARQEIRTARSAKKTAGTATAKCSAHISTLAVLHEDQADHHNGRQHLNRQ